MSNADRSPKDTLYAVAGLQFRRGPDYEAVDRLRDAASAWRSAGRHFYAGYALAQAVYSAWGDGDVANACVADALTEYELAASHEGVSPLERIGALSQWAMQLGLN